MGFKYKIITENKIDFTSKEDLLTNIGFPITDKQEVLKYLQNGSPAITTWLNKDVLKGEDIIQGYALPAYDDGEYKWTELEIFYFKKYDLQLSDIFISKVKKTVSTLRLNEDRKIDHRSTDAFLRSIKKEIER